MYSSSVFPSVLRPESEELALADSGRTNRREVVAMPLFGNSNSGHAHAYDVVDVAMVAVALAPRER